jgi:MFS family permease
MWTQAPRYRNIVHRRVSAIVDHLHPGRWNWTAIIHPLDERVERQSEAPLTFQTVRNLRYFWIDGLFAATSENFYIGYIVLYALYFGANNEQIGWLSAIANLMGALAFFPGARLVEQWGKRKAIVVWGGGGIARAILILLALFPLFITRPSLAVWLIIIFNGLRAFFANLSNPAWTALVADLVPSNMRGRYFGSRNMVMVVAALVIAPLSGRLIGLGNDWSQSLPLGYQLAFGLAFVFGMGATLSFYRLAEPVAAVKLKLSHHRGDLRRALRNSPAFVGLIVSAFFFNMSLQISAPFFNVYLVNVLGASVGVVGVLAAVNSLTALFGQRIWGRALDKRGDTYVQLITGFLVPVLPLAWMFYTAPWQVSFTNGLGGFVWAGYNLANFNLLLRLTPDDQRPRAVALYQTAVFTSAVLGPLLGGYLADAVSYKFIFGLSGAGRFLGMVMFWLLTVRVLRKRQTS